MKKGINALELVFMMFILIVVTLVLIRLFTGIVKQDTLPNIDEFRYAYNYDKEKVKCGNLCSPFTTSGCLDEASAVAFCQQKVSVDIDGDYNPGRKGQYGLIAKIPYCEDGLYCFHIYDCSCGTQTLDAKNCLFVMKEYYELNIGLDEETSNQVVCNSVLPGTCEKDPTKWRKKLSGYTPIKLPDGSVLGADYWWKSAGYAEICGEVIPTGLQLSCTSPSSGTIKCSWSGCSGNTDVTVAISGGVGLCNPVGDKSSSGDCTVTNLAAGKYNAVLDCDGLTLIRSVTLS